MITNEKTKRFSGLLKVKVSEWLKQNLNAVLSDSKTSAFIHHNMLSREGFYPLWTFFLRPI